MKIKGTAERTESSPFFLNEYAKNAINTEAKRWNRECRNRGIDDSKDFDDYAGDLYILWCECCIKHNDNPKEYTTTEFKRNSEWMLNKYIDKYFNYLDGNTESGRKKFDPDFYRFVDLYRSGLTLDEMAAEYKVSKRTIQNYISENHVTKVPVDVGQFLMNHVKLHGKDDLYHNIRYEQSFPVETK